jgi:hypothetical protein
VERPFALQAAGNYFLVHRYLMGGIQLWYLHGFAGCHTVTFYDLTRSDL